MNQKQEVPDEHSDIVGGSTAARRINCPRSYALEKLVPPDPGNAYAREGTALHEMIARVLDTGCTPESLLPFTFTHERDGVLEVSEDLWAELGQPALDAFDKFVKEIETDTGGEFEFVVETRCAMPGIAGAFGTSDIIWSCGSMSGVWDWKFGRNAVSAEENQQLMFYGRAAASTAPTLFGAATWGEIDQTREVVLSIMQPQCSDAPSEYIVTVAELEAFRVELMTAVKEAETLGVKAHVEKGEWCEYATCKAVCPLWGGQSATFGEKMAKLAALADQRGVNVEEIEAVDSETGEVVWPFIDMLPELLDLAEAATEWANTVRTAARNALNVGSTVDGWVLTENITSKRVWAVDDEALKKFFKNRRFTMDEYLPRKLVTMPAAEKLLKKAGAANPIPEDMVTKSYTKTIAMVRAAGATPLEMSSDRAKQLADKMAALNGGSTGE